MMNGNSKTFVVHCAAIALLCAGFVKPSAADVIGTQQLIDSESRQLAVAEIEQVLAQQEVAEQLRAYGVEPDHVVSRMQHMTSAELVELNGQIDKHIAGGDAIAIIGTVFLVLLILELVGVTDIFKSL